MIRNNIRTLGKFRLLFFCLFLHACTSTYTGRWVVWNFSGITDYQKFPAYTFEPSEVPYTFKTSLLEDTGDIPVPQKPGKMVALDDLLRNSDTTAFIIIRRDTLIYENYYNGYDRSSMNTSFSVAKSLTSLLIGRAVSDGLIASIDDPVTRYLPELKNADPNYERITIRHLLDMRSGIRFRDHDMIWGDKPKAYYHPRLRDMVMKLPVRDEPGSVFQYNSYNTIILGMVLESITRISPAQYFEQVIWNPLHMEYNGSWSIDSEASGMTKMESGINARAIDFAKIGQLILKSGEWNGQQIISSEWMEQSVAIHRENHVPGIGPDIYYHHSWWLFSSDQKQAEIVSGWGHLGQYIFVFPDDDLVILRFGKKTGMVASWAAIFREVRAHLQ